MFLRMMNTSMSSSLNHFCLCSVFPVSGQLIRAQRGSIFWRGLWPTQQNTAINSSAVTHCRGLGTNRIKRNTFLKRLSLNMFPLTRRFLPAYGWYTLNVCFFLLREIWLSSRRRSAFFWFRIHPSIHSLHPQSLDKFWDTVTSHQSITAQGRETNKQSHLQMIQSTNSPENHRLQSWKADRDFH